MHALSGLNNPLGRPLALYLVGLVVVLLLGVWFARHEEDRGFRPIRPLRITYRNTPLWFQLPVILICVLVGILAVLWTR